MGLLVVVVVIIIRAALKVVPPMLLFWPTTSEAGVGCMEIEGETSHQYPVTHCCCVKRAAVRENVA